MKQIEHRLAAGFTLVVSLLTYIVTLAPSVSFWDCGEFITCSVTLGIPHPPGAPLFLIIGKIFSMFPFGSDMAHRINLISALSSALTIMILYLIIARLIKEFIGNPDTLNKKLSVYGGGIIGALTFAFTDTFWFNAVEAEVYALSMLLMAVCLWLAFKWMDNFKEYSSMKYLIGCMYLFGLAVGVHLLNLLVIPTIFLLVFFYDRKLAYNFALIAPALFLVFGFIIPLFGAISGFTSYPGFLIWIGAFFVIILLYFVNKNMDVNYKLWVVVSILLFVGISTYVMIYIRAKLGPVINENDPSNIERFISYWNREQYGKESLIMTILPRDAPMWAYQIKKMYLRYFAWNFIGKGVTLGPDKFIAESFSPRGLYYLPFILGLFGLWYHFKQDWRRAFAILTMFIFTGLALVIYLNQPDPQPRERDYVYVGSFFAYSIWIGIGIAGMLRYASRYFKKSVNSQKLAFAGILVLGILMGPVIEFKHNFHEHDRRGNYMAWDYSHNILESCEPDGIIFTNGDNDTFPLWYLQEVDGVRKDVTVVNLSLLNTPWYIKQLKYGNPGAPISLTDEQIKYVNYIEWNEQIMRYPVEAELYNSYIQDVHEIFGLKEISIDTTFSFPLKPTIILSAGQPGLRVQDYMIEHIIRENKWRRPIYIAMTVSPENKIGLEPYLRIDGLALKLVPFETQGYKYLSVDRLTNNILGKFKYRGLNNPEIYYNKQKKDLLQNVRLTFITAANFYMSNNMPEEAVQILDDMQERIPDEIIPYPDYAVHLQIGQLYHSAGKDEKLIEILEKALRRNDANKETLMLAAQYYGVLLKNTDRMIEICEGILKENPYDHEVYSILINVFRGNKDYPEAINYLREWLTHNPGDENAQNMIKDLEQLSAAADTSRIK